MTKFILISGKARSGKDTTAQIMRILLEYTGKKVLVAHYADLLKYICKTFFDWNGEKDTAGRTLLQTVGTEVIRVKNPDFWVDFISEVIGYFDGQWDYVIIPDARFPNEIERIKEKYPTTTVRVERPELETDLNEAQQKHKSETALDDYEFDYVLKNKEVDKLVLDIYSIVFKEELKHENTH